MATNWDLMTATKQTVMSEDRDFSAPKESHWSTSLPLDSNSAQDSNVTIQIQNFLKSSPLGISYPYPADGEMRPEVLSALRAFELALQSKIGKPLVGTIVSGPSIKHSGLTDALNLYKEYIAQSSPKAKPEPKTEELKPEVKDAQIEAFKSFFSTSHPIIGAPYKGDIAEAAKTAESAIASAINNPAAHGSLWNDKTKSFNTTPEDLLNAVNLIVKHQSKTSSRKSQLQLILASTEKK